VKNGKPRVVMTGMGTVNPIANDVDAFYHALIEGKSGIAPLDGYPTDNITSKIAGQIKNLDISEHLGAKEIRRTARFSQIAIIAARQAVSQAGLSLQGSVDGTPDGVDRDRVGDGDERVRRAGDQAGSMFGKRRRRS